MSRIVVLYAVLAGVAACVVGDAGPGDDSVIAARAGCRKNRCVDAGTSTSPDASTSTSVTLRVHAVLLADDDGARRVNITPVEIAQWIGYVNTVYTAAQIQLAFDPTTGVSTHNSTLLNEMMGVGDSDWTQAKAAGNALAAEHPGHLVILFRYGPGSSPTGSAFAWTDYNFVVAPGFTNTWVCGHQNISLLAHEIGHYFGLPHTFGNRHYATLADAAAALAAAGNNTGIFNGDGYSDTELDPNVDEIQCTGVTQVTLNQLTFPIPRANIMSYLDASTKTLSGQQVSRVRQVHATRFP